MSFYGSNRGLGALRTLPQGYGRFADLPDYTNTQLSTGQTKLSDMLGWDTGNGTLQDLFTKAYEVRSANAPLVSRSDGALLGSAMSSQEGTINSLWNQLVAAVNKTNKAFAAMASGNPADIANISLAATDALKAQKDQLVPLGDALVKYIHEIANAGKLTHDAVVAEIQQDTAKKTVEAASNNVKASGDSTAAFTQGVLLDQAKQVYADAQTAAAAARGKSNSAATAAGGSHTLLIAAAVGIPLLGIAAYMMTKKKSGSMAGYRRRSRR